MSEKIQGSSYVRLIKENRKQKKEINKYGLVKKDLTLKGRIAMKIKKLVAIS
ncbi:hypothetical protein GHK52_10535, partial [Lactococcus garvieae]|nr:hypothetical protein [Lactococcus garvieae]